MGKKNLAELVTKTARTRPDGALVLSCAAAFKMVEKNDLKLRDIGTACNEAGVKIIGCQLGCFK